MENRELEIDDDMKAAIGTAFQSGNFVTVGYVGDDGWPRLSRRGTVQVLGSQRLALWVRKRDAGLAKAILARPEITLFYVDLSEPQLYTFYGRGFVTDDEDVKYTVYDNAPQREQAQDAERKGVPVIVELERIEAGGKRNFVMQRPV
jgi:hypothetical protein